MSYSPARKTATAVGIVGALLAIFYFEDRGGSPPPPSAIPALRDAPPASVPAEARVDKVSPAEEMPRPEAQAASAAVEPEPVPRASSPGRKGPGPPRNPELQPDEAMRQLRVNIRNFGQRFNGNPVGNNAEITAALNGKNPGQVLFLGENPELNDRGELVDRWGTPYFFHQLAGDEMEIRSAGPDRKMWTPDDPVTR